MNDTNAQEELTGMAARFIAETNAFLDQFWANPNVRWPMKANPSADIRLQQGEVPVGDGGAIPPELAAPAKLGAVPELIAKIKRLQRSQPADTTKTVIDAGGDPPVYIIFLLVPEDPPCPAAEALTRTRISGVRSEDGRPIAVDAPSPPPAPRPNHQPRSRRAATSPTA